MLISLEFETPSPGQIHPGSKMHETVTEIESESPKPETASESQFGSSMHENISGIQPESTVEMSEHGAEETKNNSQMLLPQLLEQKMLPRFT